MTDQSSETPPWLPAAMMEQWQQASDQAMERQLEMFQQLLSPSSGPKLDGLSQLSQFGTGAATFKTRVQSGGRISIPDAERDALDIQEGDIVQTIVIPLGNRSDTE